MVAMGMAFQRLPFFNCRSHAEDRVSSMIGLPRVTWAHSLSWSRSTVRQEQHRVTLPATASWRAAPILGVPNVRRSAEYWRDVLGFALDPDDGIFAPMPTEPEGCMES